MSHISLKKYVLIFFERFPLKQIPKEDKGLQSIKHSLWHFLRLLQTRVAHRYVIFALLRRSRSHRSRKCSVPVILIAESWLFGCAQISIPDTWRKLAHPLCFLRPETIRAVSLIFTLFRVAGRTSSKTVLNCSRNLDARLRDLDNFQRAASFS